MDIMLARILSSLMFPAKILEIVMAQNITDMQL